jgi:hypothetical protein
MTRPILFVLAVVLGAATALILGSFGPLFAAVFALATAPFLFRGGILASAGALIGFGSGWTGLVALQLGRGGTSGNDTTWLAIGILALVVGLGLLGSAIAAASRRPVDRRGRGGDALP